jgi:anti-sigma factor RsiW
MWDRSQESLVFVHSSADVAPPPAQPPAQPPTRRRGFLCCAGPASVDSVAAWPRRHARLDSRGVLCVFAQQGGDGEAPLLRLPLGGPDAAYRLVIPRCADVPR